MSAYYTYGFMLSRVRHFTSSAQMRISKKDGILIAQNPIFLLNIRLHQELQRQDYEFDRCLGRSLHSEVTTCARLCLWSRELFLTYFLYWFSSDPFQPLLLIVCKGVYNLYFHPLSGYPGPPAWSFTEIPNISARIRGKSYILFVDMHKKYGPVVRTGPNELSYIDSSIWNDVYAHRAGRTELPKQPNLKKKYEDWSLFDHPVAAEHTRIRKTLRLAFTEKAMREQEPRIMRLVDCLIERLTEEGRKGEVDIAKWYTLATFDIMGDLTFGEDFQGLEEGRYHRW